MYVSVNLLLISVALGCVYCKAEHVESERFLIDSTGGAERLAQLEKIVANLSATVKRQADKLKQNGDIIQHLTTENKQQKTQIQLLTTDYQHLTSKQGEIALRVYNQGQDSKHQSDLIQHLTTESQQLSTTVGLLTSDKQQMSLDLKQLQQSMQAVGGHVYNAGTTYVRWGRKDCPSNKSDLVYSGYGGGGGYDERGSAAEYICLPPDPDVGSRSGSDRGRMYGAEYNSNFFGDIHSGSRDVPCAVCRTRKASSVIMIPGKNRCYSGWKMEYFGYLASNDHSWVSAGSYVCVDNVIQFTSDDYKTDITEYGKLFLEVVVKCGSLNCPPYKNNIPLTCVVCSK